MLSRSAAMQRDNAATLAQITESLGREAHHIAEEIAPVIADAQAVLDNAPVVAAVEAIIPGAAQAIAIGGELVHIADIADKAAENVSTIVLTVDKDAARVVEALGSVVELARGKHDEAADADTSPTG